MALTLVLQRKEELLDVATCALLAADSGEQPRKLMTAGRLAGARLVMAAKAGLGMGVVHDDVKRNNGTSKLLVIFLSWPLRAVFGLGSLWQITASNNCQ